MLMICKFAKCANYIANYANYLANYLANYANYHDMAIAWLSGLWIEDQIHSLICSLMVILLIMLIISLSLTHLLAHPLSIFISLSFSPGSLTHSPSLTHSLDLTWFSWKRGGFQLPERWCVPAFIESDMTGVKLLILNSPHNYQWLHDWQQAIWTDYAG